MWLRTTSGLSSDRVIGRAIVGLRKGILHLWIHTRLLSTWCSRETRLPSWTFNPNPLPTVWGLNGLLLSLHWLALGLGLRTIALLLCLSRADRERQD